MPNSNAPGEAVQALLNDPQQLYYDPTTNREQVNAAYNRIQAEGFDAAVERVLNLDKMNASDNADAYTLLVMAKDMGDVPTFIELARNSSLKATSKYRGSSLSKDLLQFVIEHEKQKVARYLWVGHGTANPNARGFWNKYF